MPNVNHSDSTVIPVTGQNFSIAGEFPDDTSTTTASVSGIISLGQVVNADHNITFVIDVSGSTSSSAGATGTVGDLNGDGLTNTILDGEIAAFTTLFNSINSAGLASTSTIGLIAFEGTAQTVYSGAFAADADGDGEADFLEALKSLRSGGGTNYEAALNQANNFLSTTPGANSGNETNVVFFVSDGENNSGNAPGPVAESLRTTYGARFRSILIGNSTSGQSQLDLLDDGLDNDSVPLVANPSQLTTQLLQPPLQAADIASVVVTLNGTQVATLNPATDLVATPLGLRYTVNLNGLDPAAGEDNVVRVIATTTATSTVASQTVTIEENIEGTVPGTVITPPRRGAVRYDFDGDGTADVLWRHRTTGNLALSLPVFTVVQGANGLNNNPGNEWRILASGDFDADGKADIVFRNPDGSVAIWLMDGAVVKGGTLHSIGQTNTTFNVVGAGDIDGDGDDEIVFENRTNAIIAAWQTDGTALQGGNTFAHPGLGYTLVGIDDFDGDGDDEFLWRHATNGRLGRSGRNLPFTELSLTQLGGNPGEILEVSTRVIGTGDLNSDGRADILFRGSDGTIYGAFVNANGVSGIQTGTAPSNQSSWYVQSVADFTTPGATSLGNGDGNVDVLWRQDLLNTVGNMSALPFGQSSSPLLSNPGREWVVANPVDLAQPPRAIPKADFDGDTSTDILFRNPDTGAISMWQINGFQQGQGTGLLSSSPNNDWQIQGLGDYDGDGKADIAYRHTDGRVAVWLMNGPQLRSAKIIGQLGQNESLNATGDFDADGIADMLIRNSVDGTITIWQMGRTGNVQTGDVLGRFTPNWVVVGAADFDNDGRSDLLFRNRISGDLARWRMDGFARRDANLLRGGTAAGATVDNQPGTNWEVAGLGDFNGDRRADILFRNETDNRLTVWEMRDNVLVNGRQVGVLSANQRIVGIGDYNADGQDDVLLHNVTDGQITIWNSEETLDQQRIVANAAIDSLRVVRQAGAFEHYGTLVA